ncbi:hypothetical protein Tco_0902045 [Tanacetum coccineum]
MKMEILLEPTSNKLMVGDLCDSIRIKLVTTGKKRWHEHVEFDFDLDTAKDVSTAKPVSTADAAVTTASTAASATKDKGKGKMDESKPVQTKTKLEKEQERLEWEDIQAKVEADEELAQRLQAEEREMYTEAEQERKLVELINQRKESDVDRAIPELAAGSSKRDVEEELDQESSKRQKTGKLKTSTKEYWKIIKVGNHTEKGIDINILVEKEYPLSRGTLTLMLVAKLLVEQDNEMSRELLRKIFMQAERPRR